MSDELYAGLLNVSNKSWKELAQGSTGLNSLADNLKAMKERMEKQCPSCGSIGGKGYISWISTEYLNARLAGEPVLPGQKPCPRCNGEKWKRFEAEMALEPATEPTPELREAVAAHCELLGLG